MKIVFKIFCSSMHYALRARGTFYKAFLACYLGMVYITKANEGFNSLYLLSPFLFVSLFHPLPLPAHDHPSSTFRLVCSLMVTFRVTLYKFVPRLLPSSCTHFSYGVHHLILLFPPFLLPSHTLPDSRALPFNAAYFVFPLHANGGYTFSRSSFVHFQSYLYLNFWYTAPLTHPC